MATRLEEIKDYLESGGSIDAGITAHSYYSGNHEAVALSPSWMNWASGGSPEKLQKTIVSLLKNTSVLLKKIYKSSLENHRWGISKQCFNSGRNNKLIISTPKPKSF